MANISLIYPRPNERKISRFGFSYDWALLASALKKAGNNIRLFDFSVQPFDKAALADELAKTQLILMEFDTFSLRRSENYMHGEELIRNIKDLNDSIPIIVFGHHPCVSRENIPLADITVIDGEISSVARVASRFLPKYNRICLDNVNQYPCIDRKLINSQIDFYAKKSNSSIIRTSKGCMNTCVFCQLKAWQNSYVEYPDDYVLSEFEQLHRLEISNIWIVDENFTWNLTRAKRLLTNLAQKFLTRDMKICLSSWLNIDREFLALAKEANVKIISFGIESAHREIQDFYHKRIDLKHALSIIKYADEIGIFTIGNFILGAPNETTNSIEATFDFIRYSLLDQVNIKVLSYLRGTPLFDTLSDSQKQYSRIYACKENSLTDFEMNDLIKLKNSFIKEYSILRFPELLKKISKFGFPYE